MRYTWHIAESGVQYQQNWPPRYNWHIVEMALNTNKTDHHVIRYNWHIVESGIKHQ